MTVLDLVKVACFVGEVWSGPGRPQEDRRALARGFIAKAVWDLSTTRHLIDRLMVDPTLRRLCGWSRIAEVPSEATFSRDSTAFEGREKPAPKLTAETPKRKRGRPHKGEEKPKPPGRLERQAKVMDLDEMLDDLPEACDHGAKKNAKGFLEAWRGYKLHIDTGDCGVPLSAVLTSASVHDSQVADP